MAKIIGIDLGMTNSCVAVKEEDRLVAIANAEGQRTTPAVVAYTEDGKSLVGQIAKRQAVTKPENTIYSVKRFIGRKYDEVTDEAAKVFYQVLPDSHGNIKLSCPNAGKEFTPAEISAQLLRKLADDASKYLGEQVTQAVITVPVYFTDAQRQATKDAGKMAGLEVLRIINEPTAACLAYGLDRKDNEIILVFDLGGATLDVTVLEAGDGVFEVLATNSDPYLGGDNFDQKIVDWLVSQFHSNEGIDLRGDRQAMQWLTEAAAKAKIDLSSTTQTAIAFLCVTQESPKYQEIILTRTEFAAMCSDLLDRCRICIEQALKDAQLTKVDINEVVLVGGSTRMPIVQQLVQQVTGKEPCQGVDPSVAVAIGAAIHASVLVEPCWMGLLDVTPLSLGIETLGGVMTKIIPRNTTIPTHKSQIFSTATDGQTNVEIHILQGERVLANDNKSLGTFRLDGIVPAPRGVPLLEVTFDIDVNGILSVSAKDMATGKEQSMTMTDASTLANSEIERMVKDAEYHAAADRQVYEPIEARNRAQSLVYETEQQLRKLGEKAFAGDKIWIEGVVKNLQEAMDRPCDRGYLHQSQSQPALMPVYTPVCAIAPAIAASE